MSTRQDTFVARKLIWRMTRRALSERRASRTSSRALEAEVSQEKMVRLATRTEQGEEGRALSAST